MTETLSQPTISDVGRQYLQLQQTADVGPIRLRRLVEKFGNVGLVLEASENRLREVEGIGKHTAGAILRSRGQSDIDRIIDESRELGVRILCVEDEDYPRPLRNIPDPPICLFVRGELQPTDSVAVAVVGTRRCSHYGREQAFRFSESLARAGFTIVSGLARGIDGQAHRGALSGGGRTIAVLGNGLGTIYPNEHSDLALEIARHGAVVSELPPSTAPDAKNFPGRNRIVIGMSLGVIVIEAGKRSGALISARLASEYNREVFALPGRVDQPELTIGSNGLIREGSAKLITCMDDVLDELGDVGTIMAPKTPAIESDSAPTPTASPHLGAEENTIYKIVAEGCEQADTICNKASIATGRVMSALTSLQLKGFIKQLPGNRFVPSRPRANA